MKNTIIVSALFAIAAPGFCAEGEVKTFPAAGLTAIYADTEEGDISVAGAAKGEITVEVLAHDPAKCELTMAAEGGALKLAAKGIKFRPARTWRNLFGLFNGGERTDCRTGFRISAPAGLRLETRSGTGDMDVSGLSGDMSMKNGTGDIRLAGVSGNIEAKTGTGGLTGDACSKSIDVKGGTGDVKLAGLCGSVQVKTGTGGVELAWAKVPASGSAQVTTGTSDVVLSFPSGSAVGASLKTGTGSMRNEFASAGAFQVEGKSGTGDISVLKSN